MPERHGTGLHQLIKTVNTSTPVPYHMQFYWDTHPLLSVGLSVLRPRPASGPAAFTEPGDHLPHGALDLPAPPKGEFSATASGLQGSSLTNRTCWY